MTVNAHDCPGSHHLERRTLCDPTRTVRVDTRCVLVDGVEYWLLRRCPFWPATACARLIPQDTAARTSATR